MNNSIKNIILAPLNLLYKINPKLTIKIIYRIKTGYKLNLENPRAYSEKLQWIKLYDNNNLIPLCADKYTVRQYIKECGLEHILVNLLWEGFDAKNIPFEELPNKFVIKVTHGQGFNIICKDKNKLNIHKTIKQLNRWLNTKYLLCYGEWFYGVVKPRIIIEEFLDDEIHETPNDYKVYCFNGNPKFIRVHVDRFGINKNNLYDLEWNIIKNVSLEHVDPSLTIEKPNVLDQMIEYSKILSSKFIHVRVDFYIINSKIYIGELTFTTSSGFDKIRPREFDTLMGDWMKLK